MFTMREFKVNSLFIIKGNIFFAIEESELLYSLNKIRDYSINIKIEEKFLHIKIKDMANESKNEFIVKFLIDKIDSKKVEEKVETLENIVFTDLSNAEFSKPFKISNNLKQYLKKLFKDIKEINYLEDMLKKSS